MAKTVQIKWSYPKAWESALASSEAMETGVYKISKVFGGLESLLYIGLVKGTGRDFYTRMNEHRKDWLGQVRGEKYFRFGKIRTFGNSIVNTDLVEEVESALIFEIQPPENTMKRSRYRIREDLIVKSTGYRGFVPKLIDTMSH